MMISFAGENITGVSLTEQNEVAGDPTESMVRRCAAGDPDGFTALYDRWSGPMRSVAAGILGSWNDAEDAVQETFLKVARAIGRFDSRSKFSTWLFRILVNTCKDQLRKSRRRIDEAPLDPLLHVSDGGAQEPSLKLTLRRLVSALPEKERTVFVLYEVEGFSHAEIAEVLGKSESYSKWLLFTTKKRLREELRLQGETS